MLCYHGTSADNLESILKEGLRVDKPKLWTPSKNEIYCWSKNYIEGELRYGEDGPYDEEDYRDQLTSQAYDSSFVALSKSKDCRSLVVIFGVDESELKTDDSCQYMEHANSVGRSIKSDEIVEILVSNDLSLLRGYFISLVMGRELVYENFERFEEIVGQIFKRSEVYVEDIKDWLEWETIYERELCLN